MATELRFSFHRGAPPMEEWRALPHAVADGDLVVLQTRCRACGDAGSQMRTMSRAPYRDWDSLSKWAAQEIRTARRQQKWNCQCGGRLGGLIDYHAFSSALDSDLVFRFGLESPGWLERLRAPSFEALSWNLAQGHAPLSAEEEQRARGAVGDDAVQRHLARVFATGGSDELISAMNEAVALGGIEALAPYVEGLIYFTEQPFAAALQAPSTAAPTEQRVRDLVEALARDAVASRDTPRGRIFLAQVMRLRVEAAQRDATCLDVLRPSLEEIVAGGLGATPDEQVGCMFELCLVLRRTGDFQGAAARYREMLTRFPEDDASTRFDFGLLALDSGDVELVREALALVGPETAPGDAGYALLRARLLLKVGRSDDARTELERARSLANGILRATDVRALPEYLELLRLLGDDGL